MGGWKLEVARMALYIFFPVSMYGLFNSDAFAAASIKEARLIVNQAVDPEAMAAFEEVNERARQKQREEQLRLIKSGLAN